jgi:ABC-type sugar transport system ATPase subunit
LAGPIYFNARVLNMDEPTAALGPEETRMVGQLIKRLKTQGVGIILISHDINDVFDLSDRLTIMAGGRVVDTLLTKDTDEDEVLGYDHHCKSKRIGGQKAETSRYLRIPRENQMLCAQRLVGSRF